MTGAAFIIVALFYLRGAGPIPRWRAASFLAGLFCIWLASASPIAMLDHHLLTAHMIQHLLLLTIGPALILLGYPALAFRIPKHRFTPNTLLCWSAASSVLIFWHIPAVFAAVFDSMPLHLIEHATFVIAGLLFWQPVIPSRPTPTHAQWSVVLYLFAATLPCDALSAFLAFCGRVVYTPYLNMPPHYFASALDDQQCAGALMWTAVTIAYLIPAVLATMELLSDGHSLRAAPARPS
jgi:cytochrome c oxidase assembly factor CtaG